MSQPSTPNLPIPSRVGNYQLLKTIGKGQFGYVKLAIHDLTRERVAIKVIQKNRLDEKTLRMVSREISIMKLLNHPNVIRLYEVIDSEIFLFLVMEYAAGGEIMDFIVTHGKLKERDARRIFRQVVEAIDYCHEVHVIHRDLKAENLLLDSQLGIKLIDFGLSNRWAPGELLKTFCGSPTYTAPELIKRQQYEGPEVDLWSMGVLLYVLVCGSLPFDGNTFQELFTKIINGQYVVPDHVSLECRDLIGRMLVVNPKQRATLDQVREHPWTREAGKPVPKANLSSKVTVPLNEQDMDQDVIDELVNIGFERDYAIQAVLSNSYDDAAATYYLLVEAKRRRSPTPQHQTAYQQQLPQQIPAQGAMSTPVSPNPSPHHTHGTQPGHHSQGVYQHPQATHHHGRPAFDAPPPPRGSSGQQFTIPQVPSQHAPPPPGTSYPSSQQPPQHPLKRSGPQVTPHTPTIVLPSGYPMQESQNPAYRGQPRRAQRENSKGHRRHHTVGTPGEFPIEEEEEAMLQQQQQALQQQQQTQLIQQQQLQQQQQQYLVTKQQQPAQGHQRQKSGLTTPSPDTTSPSISSTPPGTSHSQSKPTTNSDHAVRSNSSSSTGSNSRTRSPGLANNSSASSLKKSGNTDEDSELMALESEQLAALNIGSLITTSTNSGKPHRGRHMRMLSNPPPIEEEDEMFYPPQAAANALSSDSSRPSRPARPTGGLPPKSATMRTEKTRHKDHSRPVASATKKKHANRTSLDPEDPGYTPGSSSSSSKDKRNSDKKVSGGSSIPTSPRVRKGSKGSAGSAAMSSSPPLSDEDSHMVLLNPSTPPHSPSTRLAIEGIPELRTSNGHGAPNGQMSAASSSSAIGNNGGNSGLSSSGGVSAPTTPFKPAVSTKKESRSIVTRFKGLFSRKGPEPRQVRFSINENNTSHEAPEVILAKVVEALKSLDLPHNHFVSPFCIKTETDTGVVLEVEICQLPIIHLIGVRFRRICGDAWQYTRVCKRVLDLLDLNNSGKSNSSPSTGTTSSSKHDTSSSNPQGSSHPQLQASSSHTASSGAVTPLSSSPAGNGISPLTSNSAASMSNSSSLGTSSAQGSNSSALYSTGDPNVMVTSDKKKKRNSAKKQKGSHATDDGGITPLSTSSAKKLMVDERGQGKDGESPRHKKASKGPTLPSPQWEDDSSSSETALVS